MRVFITGGAGFIGSHLAEYHLAKGDTVHLLDTLVTGCRDNLPSLGRSRQMRLDEGDVVTWEGLPAAIANTDRVYHLAAVVGVERVLEHPVEVISTNLDGTSRLLSCVQTVRTPPQVLIASSSEVYGFSTKPFLTETDDLVLHATDRLRWIYAITKLADELIAFSYFTQYSLPIAIIRLFNTIGENQVGCYGMVVPRFIQQAVREEPITIYGDGEQTRSFCDVKEVIVALDHLTGCKDAYGKVVNIGNDEEITINDLAKLVKEVSGTPSPIVHVSYKEAYGRNFVDIRRRKPNLERLKTLTGYRPTKPLRETLTELVAHFRQFIRTG